MNDSIEQEIILNFERARGALRDQFPQNVMEDIGFFLRSPDVSPTCKTNITVAFQLGRLSGQMTGRSALLVEIIWLCVLAKDMYIKNFPVSCVVDCLDRIEKMLIANTDWYKVEIEFEGK